jgi:hypothetical protein
LVKAVFDDVTNLIMGMLIIAFCMMGILTLVGYQDEIVYNLTLIAYQADPTLTPNQVLAAIGAGLYLVIALTISILFSIAGFQSHRDDALDKIDELMSRIEESELEEETARELIALLGEVRSRGK